MGKDRPPSYSRSSRDRESSRSTKRSEYRSMTRSPSPTRKPSKTSRNKYSRSSSSSSDSSGNESRRKGKKRDSSPIVLHSSPERGSSLPRSKWLDSSPNFQMQPMTPPSPPKVKSVSPAPPMDAKPIPSFQREDNYRAPNARPPNFHHDYPEPFNQPYGNNYFPGSQFIPPDANPHRGFNMNNQLPPAGMDPMMNAGPPPNMAGGPPPSMGGGPPMNLVGQMPMQNVLRPETSNPNMGAPWDPNVNFSFGNAEISSQNPGIQPSVTSFNRPPSGPPLQPAPSPQREGSKPSAVEQELAQQKRTLAIQREEYFKKKIALIRDLKALKVKKRELQKDNSKGSERLVKENVKLEDEIEQKLKSLDSVIEMLTHIIGDKDEIEQLLKETLIRPESPKKRKRSKSRSSSRSRSDKRKSSPMRSASPHVNIVHYDPELHWCSLCNVFPRSASVYLVHLHSDVHKRAMKDKKEKDKADEEFAPWRIHEKREQSPPVYKNAPSRRVPIRGVPFLVPSTSWYCSMCKMWLGDLEIANRHLRGEKHAASYNKYVADNPHWEVDWLRDRTRAYEKNSEARSRQEDSKEAKSLKKETKKKDTSELATTDVSKLEERLMALISASNAAKSKESTSKSKSRGRSSSRSEASHSDSSDEGRKERKKKKKNKKKKKARESRDESSEPEDHKKGKHRGDDESEVKRDKRHDDRKEVSISKREELRENRDKIMNKFRGRGRGRGQDRGRFDQRRLINRNPLWRPSPGSLFDPKQKPLTGRNELYGPEMPPKKDKN